MKSPDLPFEYALKISPRARRLRMVVKPFAGLEVVIPRNFPRQQIPRILQQHEGWITKQLHKHGHTFKAAARPETLKLALTRENLELAYHQLSDDSAPCYWHQQQGVLQIYYHQHQQAIQQLRRWLRNKARQALIPMLQTTAEQYGFSYSRVSIRSQKSRWGSCSSRGTISLNDQLMFMPQDTVNYLLIHELCHTRHMNHSNQFWQLVESCCASYQTHERVLNDGRNIVPQWFLQDLHGGR